ncbi:hypothetical protein ACFLXB_02220 [Chloroflexota bacterium]
MENKSSKLKKTRNKGSLIRFLERAPLYPFLIAIYPVVYLLSENITEIGPEAGLRSAILFLLIAALFFSFSLLLTRNSSKSGLITLIAMLAYFLVFIFIYAPAYRLLREVTIFDRILGRHRYMLLFSFLFLLVVILSAFLLSRRISPGSLKTITLAGNGSSILLLLIPTLIIASNMVVKNRQFVQSQVNLPEIEQSLTTSIHTNPDIYYIILDMLTSDNILARLLDYDDPSFADSLQQMGFYVPECGQSNYPLTQLSITSSLNMDYIHSISDSAQTTSLYPLMMNNRVRRSLEDIGYRTIAFETGYSFTEIVDADLYLTDITSIWDLLFYPGITPFESLVLKVSGGQILYETRSSLSKQMQVLIDAPYVQYRERILFAFEELANLPPEPGPKFVFAHILAPHNPFVFDEDGSFLFRSTPFSLNADKEYGWEGYKEAYVKELKYIRKVVLDLVDRIITESDTPPVIIIQGDHGIPWTAGDGAQFEIFSAYYFAGRQVSELHDEISPVNNFRVLFNAQFGTNYDLLMDESYIYDKETEITSPFLNPIPCP